MKNFININDVSDYKKLVNQAIELKKSKQSNISFNKKTLGLIFFNPSLRTRLSTFKAAQNLGMNVIEMNFDNQGWKLEFNSNVIMNSDKAEHIIEAAKVVSQYCDIVGIRSFATLKNKKEDQKEIIINSFKRYGSIPVLNLESSCYHPLQALADAITIEEKKIVKKPKIILSWTPHVKPLPHAVANSFINMATKLKYDIKIANPKGYNLDKNITCGVEIINDQEEAFKGADFVYAKNWSSYDNYGKILKTEKSWTIDDKKMDLTNNGLFMHCLPLRRNIVVNDEVLDSNKSIVVEQSKNRIYSSQIILKKLINEI
jgi:N-succinyl-L-ornithine transcarbamylase|tara:strand:- start:4863 stop:5807 length:945 start_codon:yes stop_codon:yes gene_type:complete